MSKAEINNEIILMRKVVRQAKVQTVRKWIKKADRLKKRKGNEEQLEKNKLHSEKVIAQVLAVKHVKDDEVTRFALTDSRTQKQILDDQKLSPMERGIALITFCPKFQEKLAEFKKKYPNYLEFMEGKKNKPKPQAKQDRSGGKKPEKNREQISEPARKLAKVEGEKVQEEGSEDDSTSSEDLARKFNIKPGSMLRLKPPEDEDSEEDESGSEEEIAAEKKVAPSSEKVEKLKVMSGEMKGKKTAAGGSPKKVSSPKKKVDETPEEMQMEADPFFVSNDSSTYMRVKTQKSYEMNQTGGQEKNFNQKFSKFGNDGFSNKSNEKSFKPRNERFGNKQFGRGKFNDKFGDKSFNYNKTKYSNNQQNERFERKPNRNEKFSREKGDFKRNDQVANKFKDSPKKQKVLQTRKVKSPEKQQNLHPSWEAKKKQQDALKLGFQGKKIVFDD